MTGWIGAQRAGLPPTTRAVSTHSAVQRVGVPRLFEVQRDDGEMTFWIPSSLMYCCDPDGRFTAESVARLVADGVVEGDELDFKSGVDEGPRAPDKLLDEIVAFANHRGGLLLHGVKEHDGHATEVVGMPGEFEIFRRKCTASAARRIAPTLPIEVHLLPRGDESPVWVISVAPSPAQPHGIRPDGPQVKTLSWPVRDGADTRYLSEPELADRYGRRFRQSTLREDHLDAIALAGVGRLSGDRLEWVYLACTPESPAELYREDSRLESTRAWLERTWPSSPYTDPSSLEYGVAPRRIQAGSSGRNGGAPRSDAGLWVELYQDGSCFVGVGCSTSATKAGSHVCAQEVAVVDGLIFAVQVAAQWAIERCGAWGTVNLIAGTDKMRAITRHRGHHETQLDKTDASDVRRNDLSADLTDMVAMNGRLALTHRIATELLQWYGLEKDSLITDNGQIVPGSWGYETSRFVDKWASENGVLQSPPL